MGFKLVFELCQRDDDAEVLIALEMRRVELKALAPMVLNLN